MVYKATNKPIIISTGMNNIKSIDRAVKIIEKYKPEIEDFMLIVGQKAQLKNFPMHVEIRIDKTGKINPIEIRDAKVIKTIVGGKVVFRAE